MSFIALIIQHNKFRMSYLSGRICFKERRILFTEIRLVVIGEEGD